MKTIIWDLKDYFYPKFKRAFNFECSDTFIRCLKNILYSALLKKYGSTFVNIAIHLKESCFKNVKYRMVL